MTTKPFNLSRSDSIRKTSTTIRLDDDVIHAFRMKGDGWQTRINNALREFLSKESTARNQSAQS